MAYKINYKLFHLKDFQKKTKDKKSGDEILYEFITIMALNGFHQFNISDNDLKFISTKVYQSLQDHQKEFMTVEKFVNDAVSLLKRVKSEIIKRELLERNLQ